LVDSLELDPYMSNVYFRDKNLYEKINMLSHLDTDYNLSQKKTPNMDNEMR